MDHLPCPKAPAFNPPLVPYVCTETYDGQDFLTYPVRVGWPQVLSPDFRKHDRIKPNDDEKLERFFQSWIFFGLLHEVLGPAYLYFEDDYIKTVLGSKYVHTKNLMQRLQSWVVGTRNWPPSTRTSIYTHLIDCLSVAEESLMILSQEPKTGALLEDHAHPDFNRAIKASLAAICEAVVNAADEALMPVGETNMPNSWHCISWDLGTEQSFRRIGWCANEIAIVGGDIKTLSSQNYLRMVERTRFRQQRHLHCTPNLCEELRVNPGAYKTAHCCGSGNCEILGPNRHALYRRTDAFTIPLLVIRGTSAIDVHISLVSYEPGMRYVALSHVWGDGLGNETSNQLPRCQLYRLFTLINKLRAQVPWGKESAEEEELYLWIDTLCCPVANSEDPSTLQQQKYYRKIALAKMRDIYEQAAYVLVLDSTLESYAYKDVGVVEAALRFRTSPWMHRLWTLQEGVLAKNLVIQFKDLAVDLRTMWLDARSLKEADLAHRAICLEIESMCAEIRTFFYLGEDSRGVDLAKVARAMRLRRVSKQTDEALCIASILKLDISRITSKDDDAEARMCALWHAIAQNQLLFKDIVFTTLRRLRTPGFRWAPASLQQSIFSRGGLPAELFRASELRATAIAQGLLVKLPAFKLQIAKKHPDLPSDMWSGNEMPKDTVNLRHLDGRWFSINRTYTHSHPEEGMPGSQSPGEVLSDPSKSLWDVLRDRSRPYYLIMEDPRYSTTAQRFNQQSGLITCPQKSSGSGDVMRSIITVSVAVLSAYDTLNLDLSYKLANVIRQMDFEPQDVEQQARDAVSDAVAQTLQSIISEDVNAALNNEAFTSILRGTGWQPPQVLLRELVASNVMGRYAVVDESFDPDTLWCID